MLQPGTVAPDFTLTDQNGDLRSLSEFRGRKVILYFYSKDNTSGCTKQACAYSAHAADFAAQGTVILGVSKDTAESHKKFETKHGLSITLLADPAHTVLEAYEVWKEKKSAGKVSMGTVRTTYLIGEDGTILSANGKVKAAEDAEQMLAQLRDMA